MEKIISPSISRRLWFWESGAKRALAATQKSIQPEDAGVCYVWNDRMVNISVANSNGFIRSLTSVPLLQPGDAWDDSTGPHCQWMPFQVAQVAPPKAIE